jgi:dUTP pyrophosphatase
MIKVQLIHIDAKMPSKVNDTDAGYDIYCLEDYKMMNGDLIKCSTGIKMAIPQGHVGLLKGRSGLALGGIDPLEFYNPETNPIILLGGVIDSGYRGEIGVIIKNLGGGMREIKKGDRICQIIILSIFDGDIEQVDSLDETERGEKGFGSSDLIKGTYDPTKYLK